MTIKEYRLRLKVYELKRVDELRLQVQATFLGSRLAKATNSKGKAIYSSLEDIEKAIGFKRMEDAILGHTLTADVKSRLLKITKNLQQYREEKT